MLATSLLGTAALLHGCAASVPATATVPGRAGTPMENVLAYNASLADANLAVANAVINVQKSGQISVAAANNILTAQSMIADADRQLTALLQQTAVQLKTNPSATLDAATINALLGRIRSSASALVSSGDLGIKDTATQKTVVSSMNSIVQFATSITTALNAAGLVK
jgi:hypothetical protein